MRAEALCKTVQGRLLPEGVDVSRPRSHPGSEDCSRLPAVTVIQRWVVIFLLFVLVVAWNYAIADHTPKESPYGLEGKAYSA